MVLIHVTRSGNVSWPLGLKRKPKCYTLCNRSGFVGAEELQTGSSLADTGVGIA
ncbi:hypothetical protein WAI453_011045 [Rhynchosporium graminicola]